MTFGESLRLLRNERKLNQGECADMFNLSSFAIGAYERNEREPSYHHLVKFADFYKVSIDYLMCRAGKRLTVPDYIKQNTFELDHILNTYDIVVRGYELTREDKETLSDVSVGLFWKKFS